jgi:hypothetical protein
MNSRIMSNFFLLPVAFALCISLSQAQTGTVTRVEQTDPSVTYSGSWYSNDHAGHSGGSAALTNATDAQATVTFTGTGITWIGAGDEFSGLATVSVDGTSYVVDNYLSTTSYQQSLFAVRGLAAGSHTLTILVKHLRDINAKGSWVWIDAFVIENGSVPTGGAVVGGGLTEETSSALIYTGTWYSNYSAPLSGRSSKFVSHSGGSSALAMDNDASVTISFNGTGIGWIGYADEWSGGARIYLDGRFLQPIDTYKSPAAEGQMIYGIDGLVAGTHSLTIQAIGAKRPESNGTWIWVDAFYVKP